jgi:hypothetical protein
LWYCCKSSSSSTTTAPFFFCSHLLLRVSEAALKGTGRSGGGGEAAAEAVAVTADGEMPQPPSDFSSFLMSDVAWRAVTLGVSASEDESERGDSAGEAMTAPDSDTRGEQGHDDNDAAAAVIADRAELDCIRTVGGLLFNHEPSTGVRFWAAHGACEANDAASVAAVIAAADGLALERVTQFLTDPSGPPGLAVAFAECVIGQRGTPIVAALRSYFARLQMPNDAEQWRQLLDAFAQAFVKTNPALVSSVENCARIVTAVRENNHFTFSARPLPFTNIISHFSCVFFKFSCTSVCFLFLLIKTLSHAAPLSLCFHLLCFFISCAGAHGERGAAHGRQRQARRAATSARVSRWIHDGAAGDDAASSACCNVRCCCSISHCAWCRSH